MRKIKKYLKMFLILFIILISILIFIDSVKAEPRNLSVKIFGPRDYSDIWLGVSTGGYDLIAERGANYEFGIFIKNGMKGRSLNNVEISSLDFPFQLNSITPKLIEQLKPMEIRVFFVNITVPENAESKYYPITFDVSSKEFPKGTFKLSSQIKIVKKIRTEVYIFYTLIIVLILALLFYRKYKQNRS